MKSYLLLLLIIPFLLIPTALGAATITFEEFCNRGASDNRITAADFICEVDIFQMEYDIIEMKNSTIHIESNMTDFESRLAYVETLTIPDYTKDPLVYEVNLDVNEEFNTLDISYTSQAFHYRSAVGFTIYDAGGISYGGIIDYVDIGIRKYHYGPFDMSSWNNGTYSTHIGTVDVLSNNKVIHTEPFEIP